MAEGLECMTLAGIEENMRKKKRIKRRRSYRGLYCLEASNC